MASTTSERLHRISGEAINRLRNDHEQFLEAYEKPTQIYRFLKARHSLKPLFLHRNLSYMRRRGSSKRKKRLKKLRVDDLLKHTRDQKPDLATEIKSDNYLQINFSCLEKGIDFNELLEAASSDSTKSQTNDKKSSDETEGGAGKHENHQLEVEVMLYRFKQPVAETLMEAPKVSPYSHSSLGKFVLEYQHDSNSSSLSSVTSASKLSCKKSNSTINSVSTSSGHDLTLSIPESELTWKGGSRSTGTQMLVFRASQHVAGASRNSLRKRARLPSSSKKPGRKTVALELNRINPAKFQSQTATAPSSSSSSSLTAVHDQWVTDSSNKGGRPSSGAVVETQSNRRKSSSSSVENSGSTARIVHVNGHSSSAIATSEASAKSSGDMNWSDCNHSQEEADSFMKSSSEGKNSGAARTKGVFKKTETREIGVMTDLCGIDSMFDLSSVSSSNSLPTNRKASSNLRLSLQPCPSLKKGCTDRCTSPGFPSKSQPFRNGGMVNGFTFNGYANPDVLLLRAGPGVYQQKRKKKAALSLLQNHHTEKKQNASECLLDLERNGGGDEQEAVMTHTDPETGEIRPHGEFQAVARSGGGGGELPFKVSIPRMVLNSSPNDDDGYNNDGGVVEPTADSAGGGAAVMIGGEGSEGEVVGSMLKVLTSSNDANKKGSTQSSSVHPLQKSPSAYKRRSEVQLLLDGDKPPSERLSAIEVPIFTAEDVSSRNSRNTGRGSGSGAGWLDSSTRKITPVDRYDYASVSLIEKVTGIVHSSSSSGGGRGAGGGASSGVSNSTASSRKRNISDLDGGGPAATTLSSGKGGGSGSAPPPTKQAKIVRANSSSIVNVEENSRPDAVDPSSENGAALLSPTAGSTVTQDTPTADISKTAIASYGSNSSLESVSDSLGVAKAGNSSDGGLIDKNSLFHPDDVFASELVVFDSRGDCLLQEGEYSILMQRCSKKESTTGDVPEVLTFPPLTWSSVFASGGTNSKKSENSQFQNIMLRFSLCWTHGPPKHRLCSEFDTALDLQKIRNAYFPPRSPTPPPLSLPPSLPLPHPPPSTVTDQEVTSSSSSSSEMERMSDTSPVPPPTAQHGSKQPTTAAFMGDFEEETATMEQDEEEEPPFAETMDLTSSYILHSPPPPPLHAPPLAPPPPAGTGGTGTCLLPPSRPDSSSSSISNRDKLVFNFLYNNSTLQQTESQGEMRCPWCFLCCERLYSLLKHMSLNHPRFHYTYTPSESGPSVVDVHVNKMYDAGSSILERDPGERRDILQRRRGPNKRIPCTAVLVERHAEVDEDLSEFLNDGSWKRGYIANRIYHHSRSSLPMLPEEIENESEEDEHSLEWQITSSQKMIDEFTDVNKGEKELMKLWNTFSMQNKLIAAKQIPNACQLFAQKMKEELIEKGIVQNFMTHLIALCDIGLINPTVLKESMAAVYTTSTTS